MACSGAASSTLGWGETLPLASEGMGMAQQGQGIFLSQEKDQDKTGLGERDAL